MPATTIPRTLIVQRLRNGLAICICLFAGFLNAQPPLAWAGQFGGTAFDEVGSTATDAWGNTYSVGSFRGTMDPDPGPSIYYLNSVGNSDMYVVKTDPNGMFVWARSLGSTQQEGAWGVTTDRYGYVYFTGYFNGSIDFDPGPYSQVLTTQGFEDAFVCKWTSNGTHVWARRLGGIGIDRGADITVDNDGNVISTGSMDDDGDFDPGSGTYILNANVYTRTYISKLDSSGDFVWAGCIGGLTGNTPSGLASDAAGNIYITGDFGSTTDFDPGPGVYNLTQPGGYLLKLDNAMNFEWAYPVGDQAYSVATDGYGNVVVAGSFGGTNDFDPGVGTYNLTAIGSTDCFLSKYDSSGSWRQAFGTGGSGSSTIAYAVTMDDSGSVYYSGRIQGTADLDPGTGVYNLVGQAGGDVFVSKLDSAWNFQWAVSMGSADVEYGYAIATAGSSALFVAGIFKDTLDFDPGTGVSILATKGLTDAFLIKFQQCAPSFGSLSATVCDSFTSPSGHIYTLSGTYADIIPNGSGCDSVITMNLTIRHRSTAMQYPVVCDTTFTAPDGQVYATSGTYQAVIPNSSGCDSIITIQLTVNTASTSSLFPVVCDTTYTAPDGQVHSTTGTYTALIPNSSGCDSIISIHLTVNHSTASTVQASACSTFTAPDGQVYTTSGTYLALIPNAVGCDSNITIQLTIINAQATVTNLSPTLTANPNGAQYQWHDCDNGFAAIPGATNQSFTATSSGSYAVVVTQGGICSDTSACETVTVVSLGSGMASDVRVYPNPNSGLFTVDCSHLSELEVYSATGVLVNRRMLSRGANVVGLPALPAGIYELRIQSEQGVVTKRLLLQ